MPKIGSLKELIFALLLLSWLHVDFMASQGQFILETLASGKAGLESTESKTSKERPATSNLPQKKQTPASSSQVFDNGFDQSGTVSAAFKSADSISQFVRIPVLQNALGDVIQDSTLDLLDIVRIRSIALEVGPAPTQYELNESDLNLDSFVDLSDLDQLITIGLGRVGPPHVIDATGGVVVGPNLRMIIDSGYFAERSALSLREVTATELSDSTGVNWDVLESDSNYLMKAFEISSTDSLPEFPLKLEIGLESMPPCSLQGQNLLMEVERGEFGESNITLIGNLETRIETNRDGWVLITFDFVPPSAPVIADVFNSPKIGGEFLLSVEGGARLPWANIFEIMDSEGSTVLTRGSYTPSQQDSGRQTIGVLAPELHPGLVTIRTRHEVDEAQWSLPVQATLQASADLPSGASVDSTLQLNSILVDTFLIAFSDWLPLTNPDFPGSVEYVRGSIEAIRPWWRSMIDSLMNSDEQGIKADLAEIIYSENINEGLLAAIEVMRMDSLGSEISGVARDNCPSIVSEVHKALDYLQSLNELGLELAGPYAALGLPWAVSLAGAIAKANAISVALLPGVWVYEKVGRHICDPDPYAKWEPDASVNRPKKARTYKKKAPVQICLNIFRHNSNSWNYFLPPYWENPEYPPDYGFEPPNDFDLTLPNSPYNGAVVSPNSNGVDGVVGVGNESGVAAVPGITPGTSTEFSSYTPSTGFYLPVSGVGESPNIQEQGVWFPVVHFPVPDPPTIRYPISIGDQLIDSIHSDRQRIEYRLFISPEALNTPINFGFASQEPLTLWIEDPSGNFVFQGSLESCNSIRDFASTPGTYVITVTFGQTGGDGRFTLGTSVDPFPPIAHLCGSIPWDTLYTSYSPYVSSSASSVAGGDSLTMQPGSSIEFYPGGGITATGVLRGTAQPGQPIRLKLGLGTPPPAISQRDESINHLAQGVKQ